MSVPGSLRTGADSPVIAASLTNPIPSMTSPSPAIVSPSSTTMMSPLRSSDEPTSSRRPVRRAAVGGRLRARLAQGGRLGATARLGDGLGVGREEDREPQPDARSGSGSRGRPARRPPGRRSTSAMAMSVTRTAVISTTNMTGFLISRRGSSLRKACGMADRSRSGSRTPRGSRRLAGRLRAAERDEALEAAGAATEIDGHESHQETFPAFWRSCSTIGPSASAGKNVSAPTMITTPMSRTTHRTPVVGNVPSDGATASLGRHRAGEGQDRHDHPVAADEHREAAGDVVEGRVPGQAGEGRAVVAGLAGEGVEDLAEAVRARVERAGRALGQDARERREPEDAGAEHEGDEHRHLDLERLDLLAEVLGRPADHQAGDEHRQDRADDEHAVHAGADAARA